MFAMNVFLLPKGLVKELGVMNGFWWGKRDGGNKGMHWKVWQRLSIPKKWGGLGFRKLREFNIALLS